MAKVDTVLIHINDSLKNIGISTPNNNSIFKGHVLVLTYEKPIYRFKENTYWQSLTLFSLFSVYVAIHISAPRKILNKFTSIFSYQEASQLFREEYKLTKLLSLILGINSIFVIASLIQYINFYFKIIAKDYASWEQYLLFVLIITITYWIKYTVNYALSYLTSNLELGKEYMFNVFVFAQTAGIVILPFVICLHFSKYPHEWFLYPAIVICAGFYTLRMFRTFVMCSVEQNIGNIYILLYICALEILPILVLVKFLLINF